MSQSPVPVLEVVQGVPVVLSTAVAESFEKQHKHVLDAIKSLVADMPSEFTGPNFRPSEYTDGTGRKLPAYHLTRDGFTLLAMGFTGKKALAWKLKYIQAFNDMEAELRRGIAAERHEPGALPVGCGLPRRQFFTLPEAAGILRMSTVQLQKYVTAGRLPAHQLSESGKLLISYADLDAFIRGARREGQALQERGPTRLPALGRMGADLHTHLERMRAGLREVREVSRDFYEAVHDLTAKRPDMWRLPMFGGPAANTLNAAHYAAEKQLAVIWAQLEAVERIAEVAVAAAQNYEEVRPRGL